MIFFKFLFCFQEPNAHDGIDDESVQLSFCVHSKSDSLFRSADLTLVLRADSEEDKQQWMIKLAQAIAIATNFAEYSKMAIVGEGGQVRIIHTYIHPPVYTCIM